MRRKQPGNHFAGHFVILTKVTYFIGMVLRNIFKKDGNLENKC